MDFEQLNQGFLDAFSENDPRLSQEEVQGILQALRRQIESQQKHFVAQVAEQNKQAGEEFLADNKQKEDVVTLNSGLQYKILHAGPGKGVSPTLLDTVTAHDRGSFSNGKTFDSSYERGQPAQFQLNRVIQAWSEVLKLMKVGDKWQIFVPSYLAYGEAGFNNVIGPNTALVFDIELIAIN